MKRFSKGQLSLAAGLIISVVFSFTSFAFSCADIRIKVLRLHVLANSDSPEDQTLKLKVRDRILLCGEGIFEQVGDVEEAKSAVQKNLSIFLEAARDEIAQNGYHYDVDIELAKSYFETRYYDHFTLPAGEYEAVRVLIGDAKGKNWWCVMFPAVCVPAARGKAALSDVLSEEELDVVENGRKYQLRFKSLEMIEELKHRLGGRR